MASLQSVRQVKEGIGQRKFSYLLQPVLCSSCTLKRLAAP